MTLTINLTPESRTRLNEQLSQPPGAIPPEPMPLEEWERLLRSGTVSAPPVSPGSLTT